MNDFIRPQTRGDEEPMTIGETTSITTSKPTTTGEDAVAGLRAAIMRLAIGARGSTFAQVAEVDAVEDVANACLTTLSAELYGAESATGVRELAAAPGEPIILRDGVGREVMRFDPNGDVSVRGALALADLFIFGGFKRWLDAAVEELSQLEEIAEAARPWARCAAEYCDDEEERRLFAAFAALDEARGSDAEESEDDDE